MNETKTDLSKYHSSLNRKYQVPPTMECCMVRS